jgi:hypothetical protein
MLGLSRNVVRGVYVLLLAAGIHGTGWGQVSVRGEPGAQDFFPPPLGVEPGAPRQSIPCTPDNRPQFEPGVLESNREVFSKVGPALFAWGLKYFSFTGRCNVEWAFVIRKWQERTGHSPTGILSQNDLTSLAKAVESAQPQIASDRQSRLEEAQRARDATFTMFGITLGDPLNLPPCNQDRTGLLLDITEMCFYRDILSMEGEGDVMFPPKEAPPRRLVMKALTLTVTKGVVERMKFHALYDDPETAKEFESRFGQPEIVDGGVNKDTLRPFSQVLWDRPRALLEVYCWGNSDGECIVEAATKESMDRKRRDQEDPRRKRL